MVNQINLMNLFTPDSFKIHFYFIFLPKHNHCISTIYAVFPGPYDALFFPEKCDLNSTCVLCAEGKYYFQTYKYPYPHRVKTTMKMILVAVTMSFWISMMNKLYYGYQFWYVTILFSSNKLLKLKYIHLFFFLKFLM